MSEVMLLGVLRMPPECWSGDPLDVGQRHSRYLEAATLLQRLFDHNAECEARCGIGEKEAIQCGYRPYFLGNGRRCPTCPRYEMIDTTPETVSEISK